MSILDSNGRPYRADGYINPITGYGGADDNIENTWFGPSPKLTVSELENQYLSNWIASRGVEAPVNDRLSKGVVFVTDEDDSEGRKKALEELDEAIKQADMWKHIIMASYWERLFGGGLIYFDYGDDQTINAKRQPRDVFLTYARSVAGQSSSNRLAGGASINFELRDSQRGLPAKIWVLDSVFAIPQSYYTPAIHGLDHPKLGEPEIYALTIQTTGYSRLIYAHESRCIVFPGLPLSNRQRAQNLMWGNSVLQRVNEVMKYFGISLKAMADTFEDFNYKSLQIENLEDLIANKSWEVIGKMTAMAGKNAHNQNIGVHGAETNLIKTSTTVTGLPDMATHMANSVAAGFGIPHSRLFSAEGGALAGTAADTDLKNYHETLRFDQEHKDRARIERFLFLLGFDPSDFPFVFPPLRDQTLKEKVEAEEIKVRMYGDAIDHGIITPEEAAVSLWSKPEVNLEQTIIDFKNREKIEPDEEGDLPEDRNENEGEQEGRSDSQEEFELEDVFEFKIVKEGE
jgi:hypothetical protein